MITNLQAAREVEMSKSSEETSYYTDSSKSSKQSSKLVVKRADYRVDQARYNAMLWLIGELVVVDEDGVFQFKFQTQNYAIEDLEYSHE